MGQSHNQGEYTCQDIRKVVDAFVTRFENQPERIHNVLEAVEVKERKNQRINRVNDGKGAENHIPTKDMTPHEITHAAHDAVKVMNGLPLEQTTSYQNCR